MGFLIWDFDGTLATRVGGWASTLCEVVAAEHPHLSVTAEMIGPHLRTGFPWHAHEVVRSPASGDQWWDDLTPTFGRAFRAVTNLSGEEALELAGRVRDVYLRP